MVAGTLKMRLGPLKARIITYLGTARAIIAENIPDERNMRVIRNKIEKACESLEKLNSEWIQMVEDQEEETEHFAWEKDYKEAAQGEGGFLTVLDDAQEMQGELNGHLELLTSQRTASGSRPAPVSQSQPPPQSNIRLPPNQLPVFTGNYVDWPTYWSTFESTIDKNNSFGEAEKLGYLIMTLAKLQQEEIRGYQLTTGGYQLAKAYLKARYGNEEFIKRALYKELKNLYPAKRVDEVRQNWIAMNRILMQLEKLGEDITSQSLLQDMEQKFHDWVLKEVVGEQVQKTGKWTPQKFLDVVDRVAKIREITFDIGNPSKKTGPQYAMYVAQGEMNRTASFPARDTKTTARFNHQGSTPLQQLKRPCIFCTQTDHSSAHCPTYPTKDAKINRLTALRKCLKCFGDGHFSRNCTAKIKCRKCGKGHYFAVCGERPQFGDMTRREQTNLAQGEEQEERTEEEDEEDFFINEEAVYGAVDQADKARPEGGNRAKEPTAEPRGGGSQATEVICSSTNPPNRSKTILATKYVEFMSRAQEPIKGLVFLDCGATCPFIGESFSARLGFWDSTRPHQRSLEVDGYGGRKSTFGTTLLKIGMRLRNGRTLTLNLNTSPNLNQMSLYYAINQRDFRFEEELPVKIQRRTPDVVLGLVEMFSLLERVEKITENRFVLWSSIGPIVCGRPKTVELIGGQKTTEDQYYLQCKEPSHAITDFWSLEVVGIQAKELEADDDALAWRLFKESIVRLPDGRYEVGWPWRDTGAGLSDNFGIAIGRLKSLYKRWQRDNPVVLEECHKIIKEQIESGIIEMAPLKTPFLVSYLPHQAVTKETSAFTKIRMVFDASAGKAPLNKELLRGAVLIPKVAAVLLRMRLPKYLCMSDVAKAFLQLSLRESDRDVTRFLWMKTIQTPPDGDNLVAYRFRRVPFGVVSSPFLLIATIHHHLNSYAKNQDLCNEIKASLYMDNILFGAESPEEILDKYRTTKEIFATAQMQVREFCSNCEEANVSVEEGDKHPGIAQGQIKLLGIKWLFRDDVWVIALPLPAVVGTEKLTKKGILSVIHSIFDPLGVISPTLLEAKLLFQKICSRKIGWTDPLNEEERTSFTKILGKWEGQTFRFHRSVGCLRGKLINTQLHCFVDASKDAYAAAVYLRVESEDTTNATILFAKNRIVPLDKTQNKTLTIPRLELLAILIGTRALGFVREELHIELTGCHLWSDSQIALSWVKGQRDRETFVLNRLKEIQSHEWIQFHFVPTDANPADIGTRYVTGPELSQSSLWWAGPEWLKLKSDKWPSVLDFALPQPPIYPEECFANIERIADFTHHMQGERFSRWWPLVRATIFFLRAIFKFLRRVGKTPERLNHAKTISKAGVLTSNDYKVATLELIRQAQERDPPEEKNKKNWGTFCDENGIVRCRSRLQNVGSYAFANPIFLPNRNKTTNLLVRGVHLAGMHAGVSAVVCELRQNFFIPKARQTVKKALRECLGNCKQRKPFGRPLMPPLPETRTRRSLVFAHVGLDYMGPFYIKCWSEKTKRWVLLITCLTTRLIHIEVVSEMSTQAFLNAFRKFVARRTRPLSIVSDNGAQFRQSDKFFVELFRSVLTNNNVLAYFAKEGINWHFSTPGAPWENGIVERLNGLFKKCYRRAIGRKILEEDDFLTFTCEVEAILNCRPLIPVQDELDTLVLRPIDFIYPFAKPAFPPVDTSDDEEFLPRNANELAKLNVLWAEKNRIINDFWVTWSREYLASLRDRSDQHKDPKHKVNAAPQLGEIVQIYDGTLLKGSWKIGKVVSIKSPRAVEVLLGDGAKLIRPVSHLISLEIQAPGEEKEHCHFTDLRNCGRKIASRGLKGGHPFVFALIVLASFLTPGRAQSAMLCPAADTGMFWKIKPTPTACANFTADPPFPTTHRFKIYRPNIDLLAIRAAHCSRIQETIKYKTDLVDNPHSYYSFLNLTTSKEECLRMWTFGQCQNGQLTGEARSRRTHNGQEPQFTYWQIGYKTASATDCFLTELDIYIKPGASKMSTPFSDLSHCHYRDEFCILLDGSILAWKREERDEVKLCNFIQFADWAGTFMGNIWIANNSEFALSFAETPPSVEDCKRQLSLSEQGYAVPRNQYRLLMAKKGRRSRRSADVGRVFTNQLGAQLTASQVLATEAMRKILNHLTALICAQRSRLGFGQRMFSGTEAITFARTVMNTTYVTARWISNEFLEIKHCVPIPRRNVTFLPSQKCYRDIPVNVTVLHRGMGAFLDPRTLIVEEKSIEKSCEYNQYATIYIEGQLIKINQKTGKTRVIGPEEIHELAIGDEALAFRDTDLKPHAFGNFLITNYSDPRIEVLQILQAFRLDNRFEQERLAKQIGRMGENRHINENQFDRILPKPPQWLQTLWEYKLSDLLNLICWLYVLLRIFGDWVLPVLIRYALFNMPFERQAAQRLREAAFRLRANNELIELPPGAEVLQAGRRRRRYRRPRNVT